MNINDFPILLVEDEPDQVHQVQETLSQANLVNPLRVVEDGEKAIEYLSGEGANADRTASPLPSLVLLDTTLPRLSGTDLLKWIRSQRNVKSLPVILLTPPGAGTDAARTRELGANYSLVKPVTAEGLRAVMKSMGVYWMLLDQGPGAIPPETALPGTARPRRVLVADPDVDFLRAVREALRRRDPSLVVDVASTAPEALEKMALQAPDALAFEPGIEGGGGLDFLASVLAGDPGLPVLILSETGREDISAPLLKMGAWGVLLKGVRLDHFVDRLQKALAAARRSLPDAGPAATTAVSVPAREPAGTGRGSRSQDTDILGQRVDFQETSWGLVRAARDPGSLDTLIRLYWKALYFFVRQQGYDNETAKDIVQEFLLNALEHDTILKADRTRGRFRTYLLATLGNFLKDRHRSSGRRKRGGGRLPLSLDWEASQQGHLRVDDAQDRPEAVVDRAWARDTLQRCISKLRGKPSHLQAFELSMNGMDYGRITEETGLGESAAKTAVHRLRRKLRDIIRGQFGGPQATEEEVDTQVHEFSSLLR